MRDAMTEQRVRLLGAKLRGLVGDHLGTPVSAESHGFGAGVAVVVDHAAWVLIDGSAQRRLGAALAWAIRHEATSLHVIAETDGGTVARRASGFDFPISVWFAHERSLLPVVAEARMRQVAAPAEHSALASLIEEAGAKPHIEHGVVTGEVRGLEVCRVVDEPTTGNFSELLEAADRVAPSARGVSLEVGVGANDREAFQLLHGHIPTVDALRNVVDAVSSHRSVAARQHPLNRMAPERFLRWQVEEEPERLCLASLAPVEPPVARQSMKHVEPCVAEGIDDAGRPVTVVFSSGVDVDLIAFVADVTLGFTEPRRTLVTAPQGDLVPITRDLAALLSHDVEVVAIRGD